MVEFRCSTPEVEVWYGGFSRQAYPSILTNWYEKDIRSDRILNYYSQHPFEQKFYIISLKDRMR